MKDGVGGRRKGSMGGCFFYIHITVDYWGLFRRIKLSLLLSPLCNSIYSFDDAAIRTMED